MRRFILAASVGLFCFLFPTQLSAQEDVQYAVMVYRPFYGAIAISLDGVEYKEIRVEGPTPRYSANPALLESKKLIAEGWELLEMNSTGVQGDGLIFVFYFKKEKD